MVLEQQLRVPGPTPIPDRVQRAASRPMINHRGPEFADLMTEVTGGLRTVLRTESEVLLYPASGTGGLEAAVVNLLSPGEKALFCTVGSFGVRWADIAAGYGAEVARLEMPWGEAIDAEDVERVLAENPEIQKVFVTHNETSTGVTNDIPAIASVVKGRGKLIAVDSVSGASCLPLETDALGLDVVVTGSQKGWMAPPGLAMIAVNKAAFAAATDAKMPRWYFDFAREQKYQEKKQTYTTPPIQVMYAVQEGLRILLEEGVENSWKRHERIGTMIRAGVEAAGMKLFAAQPYRSNTVTAVRNPAGSSEKLKELLVKLRTEHGLVLAGGQNHLQGEIFRIGHLGAVEERDVYSILALLEKVMSELGLLTRVGLCVAAAQNAARGASAGAAAEPAGVR
ncbi:MAG: pyridoxal-phosphate-dependent aminotransferase family protein [Candidatus Dormibacteria bacterium]